MASQPSVSFTDDDLRSLGRKLRAFRSTLSPSERRALGAIVRQAAGRGDVVGFVELFPILPGDPDWDVIVEQANEVELDLER